MWDFFSEIWVINLDSRKDRKEKTDAIARKLNIPIRYYHPERNKDGKHGCYESHQHIMRNSRGDHVLIFEDDIEVRDFDFSKLAECIHFMASTRYDVFFLGCFPDVWKYHQRNVGGHIYNVHATQAHAYVINKSYRNFLKNRPYDGLPFDNIFKENNRSYAYMPGFFVQGNSKTDVSSIEFISAMPGKNQVIYAIEQYASAVGIPISSLFVLFMIVWYRIYILRC